MKNTMDVRRDILCKLAMLGVALLALRFVLSTSTAQRTPNAHFRLRASMAYQDQSTLEQQQQQQQQQQQEAWQAAMETTHTYCKQVLDSTGQVATPPVNSKVHAVRVPGRDEPVHMYLIGNSDIVSNAISTGGWEGGTTAWIMERLRQSGVASPLFVDIGANVGTHAVQVAAAGFRTLAIEGAPTNQALLRTTFCANQQLLSNMTLIGTALGSHTQNCSIWAPSINTGNGMMFCDDKQADAGMVRLGDASTRRLDDLLTEPVEVMKMDVEGFEGHVLAGATHLLSAGKVKWLTFEYSPAAVVAKGGDPWALLVNLIASGFDCGTDWGHKDQSQWEYMSKIDMMQLAWHVNTTRQIDLYCQRRREPLQFLA